jgi:hypothetical protein
MSPGSTLYNSKRCGLESGIMPLPRLSQWFRFPVLNKLQHAGVGAHYIDLLEDLAIVER